MSRLAGSLPPEWAKQMADTLKELNEEVFTAGIAALTNVPAPKKTDDSASSDDSSSSSDSDPPKKPKKKSSDDAERPPRSAKRWSFVVPSDSAVNDARVHVRRGASASLKR